MIGEQMDILNSDFINQKLESLNRRVEQLQCKDNHEEIAKALLVSVFAWPSGRFACVSHVTIMLP